MGLTALFSSNHLNVLFSIQFDGTGIIFLHWRNIEFIRMLNLPTD